MRRNRFPTATVHADPRAGLPSQLFGRVREKIEADFSTPLIHTVRGMGYVLRDES